MMLYNRPVIQADTDLRLLFWRPQVLSTFIFFIEYYYNISSLGYRLIFHLLEIWAVISAFSVYF